MEEKKNGAIKFAVERGNGGAQNGGKGKYFGERLGGQQTRMHLKIALGFYNHRPIPCRPTARERYHAEYLGFYNHRPIPCRHSAKDMYNAEYLGF